MPTVINLDIWAVGGEHAALNLWFAGFTAVKQCQVDDGEFHFYFPENISFFNFFTAVKECQVDNGEFHFYFPENI